MLTKVATEKHFRCNCGKCGDKDNVPKTAQNNDNAYWEKSILVENRLLQ